MPTDAASVQYAFKGSFRQLDARVLNDVLRADQANRGKSACRWPVLSHLTIGAIDMWPMRLLLALLSALREKRPDLPS
jgi:hypothetical protein